MSALITLAAVFTVAAQDPEALSAPIAEVTVFPGSALVRRHAQIDLGAGRFVIAGLPWSMDPDSVRVRCAGAEVVGTEARERFLPKLPEARLEELRVKQRGLERELRALQDELELQGSIESHLQRSLETAPAKPGDKAQSVSLEAWSKNLAFVAGELSRLRAARRELQGRVEELQVRIADVQAEVGRSGANEGVHLRDVYVDLAGGAGSAQLDLEYVVGGAGWEPLYDLRASSDGRKVELGYRANVWQRSGEDWNEVELSLSTAAPRLGAQGPDPEPIWLSFAPPARPPANKEVRRARGEERKYKDRGDARDDDAENEEFDASRYQAQAERQGLSIRFRLARKESVPSRRDPSSVLVGQAQLEATPEYFCAPEVDDHVWLRGRTVNSSPWTLLPGQAAVYFGADYLGTSQLAAVQPGAEFTLHLGLDPALSVERSVLEDVVLEPGMFSSKATHKESFRVRIENHGAAVVRADGSALVFVREALPRASDERIEVELSSPKNRPLAEARWTKEREEQGIVTWVLAAPAQGEGVLEFTRKVIYPAAAELISH